MDALSQALVVTGGMDGARLAVSRGQSFHTLGDYPTLAQAFHARKAILAYAAALDLIDSVAPSITERAA